MARAVISAAQRQSQTSKWYHVQILHAADELTATMALKSGAATAPSDQIVVTVDWSTISNHANQGGVGISTDLVADQVAALLCRSYPSIGLELPLSTWPLHLIGHSRGGSVVLETARLLGERGLWVDHVTTLDPHPLTWPDYGVSPAGFDPPIRLGNNVVFADNYWREDVLADDIIIAKWQLHGWNPTGMFDFNGHSVAGAHDLLLSEATLNGLGSPIEHSDVHTWYHGTIETADGYPASDGEQSITDAWYGDLNPSRYGNGFALSRIAYGGVRQRKKLRYAIGPAFGGTGARSVVGASIDRQWANVGDIQLPPYPANRIVQGEDLVVKYKYQDRDSGVRIDWFVSSSVNPAVGLGDPVAQQTLGGAGDAVADGTVTIGTAAMTIGPPCHVLARITSLNNQAVRWDCSDDTFSLRAPAFGVADVSPSLVEPGAGPTRLIVRGSAFYDGDRVMISNGTTTSAVAPVTITATEIQADFDFGSTTGTWEVWVRQYIAQAPLQDSSKLRVEVSAAAHPPVISITITAPESNATVSGPVAVKADAASASRVEFLLDGVPVAACVDAPFGWLWNTTQSPNGAHVLLAKAYVSDTIAAASAPLAVTIANSAATLDADGNDRSLAATALTAGVAAEGFISSPTDIDWYRLDVPGPGRWTFNLSVPAGQDYDLELFGPDATYLKGSYQDTGAAESITLEAAAPGVYYVRVYGYPVGNGSFSATAPYALTVTVPTSVNIILSDLTATYDGASKAVVASAEGVVTVLAGAGSGPGSTDGTGNAARFNGTFGVAADSAGNVYVSDYGNSTIRKITSSGVVTAMAGTPGSYGSADGTGSDAQFQGPFGLAVDSAGNVYVADRNNHTIRKITSSGVVTTLAGTAGSSGSANGTGAAARFYVPAGVAVDNAGNVFVADTGNATIRKITSDGVVTTLAGLAGNLGSSDGTGGAARFISPQAVAIDTVGSIYVADSGNATIRKITSGGVVTTLAGLAGNAGSSDGTGNAARFNTPTAVAVDATGTVYVAEGENLTIRRITSSGVVTTLAGATGSAGAADGIGSAARFNYPTGVAVDGSGNLFVADFNNSTIRKITSGGVVTTFAGTASGNGSTDGIGSAARFSRPKGLTVDGAGNVFVADTDNQTIRKVTSDGVVTTLAGMTGSYGSVDEIGSAARFSFPFDVAMDNAGNVVVADTYNHTIRRVTSAGAVTTVAGVAGVIGSADGITSAAQFFYPTGVAVDNSGAIYVVDGNNHTIRKIAGGVVVTVAGTAGSTGSADGTGSFARFHFPYGVAMDSAGALYVSDMNNHTIRKITTGGVVTTLAGVAGSAGSADGIGSAARFHFPQGVAVDGAGNVYVADSNNSIIRKITGGGVVTTLAGVAGSQGSINGAASATRFNKPGGLTLDNGGNVLVADTNNHSIRKIALPGGAINLTYNGSSVAPTAAGNYHVVATLSDANYQGSASGTLVIAKANQTIAVAGPWNRTKSSTPVTLEATASSGLAVSFSLVEGPATLNGHTLIFTGNGTVRMRASQSGDSNHNAALAVDLVFTDLFSLALAQSGAGTIAVTPDGSAAGSSIQSYASGTQVEVTIDAAAGFCIQSIELSPSGGVPPDNFVILVTLLSLSAHPGTSGLGTHFYGPLVMDKDKAISVVFVIDPLSAVASSITTQPADKTVAAGQSAAFTVVGSGVPLPSYQWQRQPAGATGFTNLVNAGAYAGATTATLTVTGATVAMSGDRFQCIVTNGVTDGVVSDAATLAVAVPPVAPSITTQPVGAAVTMGQNASFSVVATGTAPLSYQWRKGGVARSGATDASLTLTNVQPADSGSYDVVVSNGINPNATSDPAVLNVVPTGVAATHAGVSYVSNGIVGTFSISNRFTYVGSVTNLRWSVLLPTGWSFVSSDASGTDVQPVAGATSVLEWKWSTPPPSGVSFTYSLNLSGGDTAPQPIAALMNFDYEGIPLQITAKPDPLMAGPRHSADTDHDGKLSLTELLRVIELYNTRNGTVRTGAYVVDANNLEDGFATDAARLNPEVVTLARYHSADTNHDGKLSLTELLRVIELYNHRSGTVRTGQYHVDPLNVEDGFAPGP